MINLQKRASKAGSLWNLGLTPPGQKAMCSTAILTRCSMNSLEATIPFLVGPSAVFGQNPFCLDYSLLVMTPHPEPSLWCDRQEVLQLCSAS